MSNSPYGEPDPQQPGQGGPTWGANAPDGQFPGATSQPGSKFGTNPYDPATAGAPMQKPAKHSLLEKLTLISMALYLVGSVGLSLAFASDEMADFITDLYTEMGLAQEEIDAIIDMLGVMSIFGAVVSVVIAVALYMLVYIGLTKSKSWARVVGLVFAFIGLASTLLTLVSMLGIFFTTISGLLAALAYLGYIAVTIYWIVVAFNEDVRRYLEQSQSA